MTKSAYGALKDSFERMSLFEGVSMVVEKDREVSMPKGAEEERVKQSGIIADMKHEMITDPRMSDLLDEAEQDAANLEPMDQRNLQLMRERWAMDNALPADLARQVAQAETKGYILHDANYKSGDWNAVSDWYDYTFKLTREVGQAMQSALGASTPYEALLRIYNPGVSVVELDREFSKLDKALRPMIQEAVQIQTARPAALPVVSPITEAEHLAMCEDIARVLGFDFNRGRFDVVEGHPTMTGTRNDTRLTTRLEGDNGQEWVMSLYSIIHEAGHGIYQQGLPEAYQYQPVGQDYGLHVHESQSMIMERAVCKTPEFFALLSDKAQNIPGAKGNPAFSAKNIERYLNGVAPSMVRIYADELTYPMHVILRYELAKHIIDDGSIDVKKDLPHLWREAMKAKLGIEPANDAEGCMQDCHWPCGSQGYFPAYALGAMLASQFFAAAERKLPNLRADIRKGDLSAFNAWQRASIHEKGSSLGFNDLVTSVTGEGLNSDYFLDQMSRRYLGRAFTP